MADLSDLKLDKEYDDAAVERAAGRPFWRVALIFCLFLVIGFLVWNVYTSRRRASQPVQVQTDQQAVRGAPRPPEAVAGEQVDLPPLGDTDPVVRELVGRLSSHPLAARWLATDQLIRNFTVVLVNIADGKTPARFLSAIRPAGEFIVAREGGAMTVDPRSYRRYDAYADAVGALDAEGTARLFATLEPRIQDAYRELGYPDGNVDAAVQKAFVHLLETPVIEGELRVTPRSVAYDFSNPRLQSLSSAQRQFLRMGPRNVKIVRAKLREIARFLGIAPDALPR